MYAYFVLESLVGKIVFGLIGVGGVEEIDPQVYSLQLVYIF